MENIDLVRCQKCKEYLPRESFYRNRSRENGFQIFCKECTKIIVKDYEQRRKTKLPKRLHCVECGNSVQKNSPDRKCGECRHRERMRLKYREDPMYYKIKHAQWRKRHAALNSQVEQEELELVNQGIQLTKGEMTVMTNFNYSAIWMTRHQIDPLKINVDCLEHLHELGLIEARDMEGLIEYRLTDKGLDFLGIASLEE